MTRIIMSNNHNYVRINGRYVRIMYIGIIGVLGSIIIVQQLPISFGNPCVRIIVSYKLRITVIDALLFMK